MAAVHCPKLGFETLSKIVSFTRTGIISTLGVRTGDLQSLVSLTQSPTILKKLLIELGTDVVLLIINNIKGKRLSLICDKGENKGPEASFVKLLCWYNKIMNKVETICFGIESAGNTSTNAAQGIDHLLKYIEYN